MNYAHFLMTAFARYGAYLEVIVKSTLNYTVNFA